MIKVTCYNKVYEFKNDQEAYDFFKDCFMGCDPLSSEAARYMTIIQAILEHQQTIVDEQLM